MEVALSLVSASFYNAECCQVVVLVEVVEDEELEEVTVVVKLAVILVAVVW